MMQSRFYAVTAKCGHVGRNQYYEGTFYIRALTGSEAAAIARDKPRVKHDHKDAILWVEEITAEDYKAGLSAFRNEAYFLCENRQEQNLVSGEISSKIRMENDFAYEHRQKGHCAKCAPEIRFKKPYKREKLILCEDDFGILVA